MTIYYKITNETENHYGYQYKDGLNVLEEPFNEKPVCRKGGLYFTTSEFIHLFENYGLTFPESGNNKFNKNVILFELREMTNLSTKEIRNSMKKFKKLYLEILQDILKD